MDALIVLGLLAVAVLFVYIGVKLIKLALESPAAGGPPRARIANPPTSVQVVGKVGRFVSWVGRAILFGVGLAFAALPFAVVYALHDLGKHMGGSKGRVLRIRNRAQLAEPALGDGWTDAAAGLAGVASELAAPERAALGALWLLTARMEHASVAAFSQLSLHLAALGAPADLLEATHRAALEEIRHARACFAIARAITGEPHTAGPIAALGASRGSPIDLTRLAVGSLVDGCLAEGIAADVAARSSARAELPAIRATLAMIARDEAGHAQIAWDVLAWCLAEGGPAVHAAVAGRVAILDRELAPRLPDLPGVSDLALARYGVIDQDALGALAAARVAAVQARARAMLAPPAVAVAA